MIEAIKKIIVEKLDINVGYHEVDENTKIFDEGLAMDSIVFTEFCCALRELF